MHLQWSYMAIGTQESVHFDVWAEACLGVGAEALGQG